MKNKVKGGIIGTIGYFLSPLSWWNDLFLNLPLSYVFAFPFGLISKSLFFPMMIFGYWVTNIVGLIMLHHGARNMISKEKRRYTRDDMLKDVIISLVYTIVVIILILVGWLRFPLEYFS